MLRKLVLIAAPVMVGASSAPLLAEPEAPAANHVESAAESANILLVKGFLADIRAAMGSGDVEQVRAVSERYMAEDYLQHSSTFAPGREGFIQGTASRLPPKGAPAAPPLGADGPRPMPRDLYFFADGDFAIWVSEGLAEGKYIFNMVRIEDRKMKEHWSSF